jgi:Fe-Mn family superoxide dismutase
MLPENAASGGRSVHENHVRELNLTISKDLNFFKAWEAKWINGQQPRDEATARWLDDMLRNIGSTPASIRDPLRLNAGGHYNHSLFWQMMKPEGGGGPKGALAGALTNAFGGLSDFKAQFTAAALGHFGSGWAWLILDGGLLKVETTANEDTPLSEGREVLLGLDLWEHAYYLDYQNRRADYVSAWWNVVNWDFVAERYSKLKP